MIPIYSNVGDLKPLFLNSSILNIFFVSFFVSLFLKILCGKRGSFAFY